MKKAVVLYMPVIHKGYDNFLEEFKNQKVFVVSEEIIDLMVQKYPEDIRSVVRDVRRMAQGVIVKYLQLVCQMNASVLQKTDLPKLIEYDEIVLPRDSFSAVFAVMFSDYCKSIVFEDCFLRFDMPKSLSRQPECFDTTINFDELRSKGVFRFMENARTEASKSPDWWRQVGAVLVKDGQQILTAFNTHMPSEFECYFAGDPRANFNAGEHIEISKAGHAERRLISHAAKKGISTEDCEIFVTTFPCPPCAYSIIDSGIKRVYFIDGYSVVDVFDTLKKSGVEIVQVVSGH